MAWGTYGQVIKFIESNPLPPLIMLSGGEPTDHPEIFELIEYAQRRGIKTVLLSNGEWLHDGYTRTHAILHAVGIVQVTNDPRYYPRHVEKVNHPKVCWETELRQISPHGRAVTNKITHTRRAPECFNIRIATRHLGSWVDAKLWLMDQGYLCSPSINVDGTVRAGETAFCAKVGHVTDSAETITRNLYAVRCSKCGLVDGLTAEEKAAIGED